MPNFDLQLGDEDKPGSNVLVPMSDDVDDDMMLSQVLDSVEATIQKPKEENIPKLSFAPPVTNRDIINLQIVWITRKG